MNRKEFIRRVASEMRQNKIKKKVRTPKHVLHISDDKGNHKDFVVKATESDIIFTIDDIEAVINTCIDVIHDSIRHGETITFHGFGSLGLRYRKPRHIKQIDTDQFIDIEGGYLPKFSFGRDLKTSATIYGQLLDEQKQEIEPYYDDEDFAPDGGEIKWD